MAGRAPGMMVAGPARKHEPFDTAMDPIDWYRVCRGIELLIHIYQGGHRIEVLLAERIRRWKRAMATRVGPPDCSDISVIRRTIVRR